jgi:hypothetical protein
MMTGPPGAENPTALSLLFAQDPSEADIEERLTGSASLTIHVDGIEPALRHAAERQVAAAVVEVLHLDLIDVLVSGWRKYEDLTAAARRTLGAPGSTEVVQLADHRVTCSEAPFVTVDLDGATVATVHLDLSLVFDVSVLTGSVRAGKLVALQSGRCDITGTLAAEDVQVAEGHQEVDLRLAVQLGDGLTLLDVE